MEKLLRQRFFIPLLAFTFAYLTFCSLGFYLAEAGHNPQIRAVTDAVVWVSTTIPFLGRLSGHPATHVGMGFAILSQICGVFALGSWVILVGRLMFK